MPAMKGGPRCSGLSVFPFPLAIGSWSIITSFSWLSTTFFYVVAISFNIKTPIFLKPAKTSVDLLNLEFDLSSAESKP